MAHSAVVTEAKVERVVRALLKRGLTISECVITPTEVRLIFGETRDGTQKIEDDGLDPWPTRDGPKP